MAWIAVTGLFRVVLYSCTQDFTHFLNLTSFLKECNIFYFTLLRVQLPGCLVLRQLLPCQCLEPQADWSRGICLSSSSVLEHFGISLPSCLSLLSQSLYPRAICLVWHTGPFWKLIVLNYPFPMQLLTIVMNHYYHVSCVHCTCTYGASNLERLNTE